MTEDASGFDQELYNRVEALVGGFTRRTIRRESRLCQDLGIDGMDAHDLMVELEQQFGIDMSSLVFSRHFGPEAGLNLFVWIYWVLFQRKTLNQNLTAVKSVPITVNDLYDAAKSKRFPDLSGRPAS